MTTTAVETLSPAAWEGIERLLDTYVRLEPTDQVVIAYTRDCRQEVAWVAAAAAERACGPAIVPMRPLVDDEFEARLREALPAPDEIESRLVLLTFERETMSHNPAILGALAAYDDANTRVFRAISTNAEMFEYSFTLTPEEMSARNTALLEPFHEARQLRVEADGGTDLSITLDNSRFRWISNRGIWRPGKFVVVPCGEIATFAANMSGTLVADYAINVNTHLTLDARLQRSPVTVRIEENRAVDVECDDAEMLAWLEKALSRPHAKMVGELGFGTNAGVTGSVAMNSHTNERRPGIHLGFGQHNQLEEVAGYFCDIHVDLCARGARVWVDDDPQPLDLEAIEPSANPHPPIFDEEDVLSPEPLDGDCCGLYAG